MGSGRIVSYSHYINVAGENKDVVWLGNAYPKCCYFLAIICIERGDFTAASEFLQKGIELEPDNPKLLSEMGLLLGEIGTNTGDKIFLIKLSITTTKLLIQDLLIQIRKRQEH